MRKTRYHRFIAIALSFCMVMSSFLIQWDVKAESTNAATWKVISGNAANLVTETEDPTAATFTNGLASAYYDQKIDVQDGTKISVEVSFPSTTASDALLYAFALVDRGGSFYNSDRVANSLMAELSSGANSGTVNGVAAKKIAGNNRAWLANLTNLSIGKRSETNVYKITYEKIDVTEGGVNYSWKLTMKGSNATQTYMVKASDISHTMFENGAYFAAGIRDGKTTHTMKMANLTVTQPDTNNTLWKVISGNAANLVTETEDPTAATFTNGLASAYYDQKIDVQDGTKISVEVSFPSTTASDALLYAFALVDRGGSFYNSDRVANSLMAELSSGANSGTVNGVAAKKIAGNNRAWLANLTNLSIGKRSETNVYEITYEKIDVTEGGVNYSWKLTMKGSNATQTYMVKASDISHTMFENGAYFAAGIRDGKATHTMKMASLTVTQPDNPVEPVHTKWQVIKGEAANLTEDTTNPADATFNNFVTANFKEKIEIKTGTKISFDVNYSAMTDNLNAVYAFALVDRAGSFDTSDTEANSLSVEISSISNTSYDVRGVAAYKLSGSAARAWAANIVDANSSNKLSAARNTSEVYSVTYEKLAETEANSWKITITTSGGNVYTCLISKDKIPHDMFADGAYFAAGSRNSITTHTVNIKNLTVTQQDLPDVPVHTVWQVIKGEAADLTEDTTNPADATFNNSVAAYYKQKIDVVEGTQISFKVNYAQMTPNMAVNYAYALVDREGSFDTSDAEANSLSVELNSMMKNATTGLWPVAGVVAKKLSGDTARKWVANMDSNPLSTDRNVSEVYTITYEKLANTGNYSWKITVETENVSQTYKVKATDIPHDMFANGAYIAAGSRMSNTTHTMKITGITIGKKDSGEDSGKGPWGVIAGNDSNLTVGAAKSADATFKDYVTAYYNQKIDVEEGTRISFKVNYSQMMPGQAVNYAFSLVDRAGSFDTSDAEANSLSVELNSMTKNEKTGLWPVAGVVAKKLSGDTARKWIGNLDPNTLSTDRNTADTYTVTYKKVNLTVNNVNYSWKITVEGPAVSGSYMVKATDIPHDMFANGAYIAAGPRMSNSPHTMQITDIAYGKSSTEEADDIWTIIRGYSGAAGRGLSTVDGNVVMEGFGGLSYTKSSVKNAVAVEFELNNFDEAKGNFFTFALINKPGVYYRPDGSESDGIFVRIKENEDGLAISVHKVNKDGTEDVGIFNTVQGKNKKHTLAFFKEGGTWYVAIDGQQKMRFDGDTNLKDVSYFCGGANNTAGMKMTVSNVYVDGEVTAAMKSGTMKYGYKIGGFEIIRGYGKGSDTTGNGLSEKDGKVVMEGFGGLAYVDRAVKDAVAVDFEMNNYNTAKTFFFTFALVNKEGVYYNPSNGAESQGVFVRIMPWNNGQGINVTVYNLSESGYELLGTISSNVSPKNVKHNLAFYKEDGTWYIAIDGYQRMRLDVEVALEDISHLVCGANPYKELKMSVQKVYIDNEVTDEMRKGTLKSSNSSSRQSGKHFDVGGSSFGVTSLSKKFTTSGDTMTAGNLLLHMNQKLSLLQKVLIGLAGVCLLCSIVPIVQYKKRKKTEGEKV